MFTIKEIVSSPTYDAAASEVAKSYIFLFFLFCGIIAYVDRPELGFWWIAVLLAGLFISSIFFAVPVTLLKLFLGSKGLINPFSASGRLFIFCLDLVGYAAMWFATRYVIGLIASVLVATAPTTTFSELNSLERLYLDQLRAWIDTDGRFESIQERVLQPCGKLVMLTAGTELTESFLRKENMDEYDFRNSFCMKATVHQKFPQPEFEDSNLIRGICNDKDRLFWIICNEYRLSQ